MSNEVQTIIDHIETLRLLFDDGAVVTVLDTEANILAVSIPAWMQPMQKVGDKLDDPTGAFQRCVSTGKVQHNILPKEVVGVSMEGNLVPIFDEGKVAGVVVSTYVVDDKMKRAEMEQAFNESMEKVNVAVSEVTNNMEQLSADLKDIIEHTNEIELDVNEANKVVGNVGKNASHSNILALNASIEAARSGEAGRGFSVVAQEMGKLATESSTSAAQIKKTLDGIVKHLERITENIKKAGEDADRNTECIEEINSVLKNAFDAING